MAAPYLVGILLDNGNSRQQWNLIFFVTAGLYVFGAITFILFGTDKQQSWDNPSSTGDDSGSVGSEDTIDFDKLNDKRQKAT